MGSVYVPSVEAVRRAIHSLVHTKSHEHLPGYLAIYKAQAERGGKPAHMVDIQKFHDDYLRVEDAPEKSPFIRPFRSRGVGLKLLNVNVAGSYAPSSVRTAGTFPSVVEVRGEGMDGSYSLPEGHAALAVANLLGGHRIPVAALAIFLLRDYGVRLQHQRIRSYVDAFREEFRFRGIIDEERAVFDTLFEDDVDHYKDTDLEPFLGKVPA